VWLAAARRFLVLFGAIAGAIFLCAVSLGLILAVSLNRAIALGFEVFGCLLLVFGFFVGNRGPVRTKGDATPFFGPRFLRWATPEEHQSTIAESAIFIVLGILLIVIGLAVDARYRLI
jgi:uncharacterized membrane protein